jgi:hypothetical protein
VGNVDATDPAINASVRQMHDDAFSKGVNHLTEVVLRIALDSTDKEAKLAIAEGRADDAGDGPIAHADVESALVGAILGTEFAVPEAPKTAGLSVFGGAVIGGLIGGAAGSIAQAL